jgi:transcriptional regulator with XRE-family HTH domain
MVNNEVVSRIAQKIKSLRLQKNLTIQELATRTKVTKGLLSKVENLRTIPSLPVFIQIIQSLDVSLKEFFGDMVLMNGKNYLLIKKDHCLNIEREGRNGFNYQFIMSQNIGMSLMEAVVLRLRPGATGRETTADGYEFKYMISGVCEYKIGNEVVSLCEGDTIYFDASIPHLPINNTKQDVVMLVIYFIAAKDNAS